MSEKLFLLLLFLGFGLCAYGQGYRLQADHYTAEDGLSHNAVSNIFEDSRGLLWLTTRFGVNRFDGNQFRVYTKEEHGLHSNNIGHVMEDPDGLIWMLNGLNGTRYTAYYNSFTFTLFDAFREKTVPAETYLPAQLRAALEGCKVYAQMPDRSLLFVSERGYFVHYRRQDNYSVVQLPEPLENLVRVIPLAGTGFCISQGHVRNERERTWKGYDLTGKAISLASEEPTPWSLPSPFTVGQPYMYWTGKSWLVSFHTPKETTPNWRYIRYGPDLGASTFSLQELFPELPDSAQLRFFDERQDHYWIQLGEVTLLMRVGEGTLAEFPGLQLPPFVRADRSGNLLATNGQDGFSHLRLKRDFFSRTGIPGHAHRGISFDTTGRLWAGIETGSYARDLPVAAPNVVTPHNHAVFRAASGDIWTGLPYNVQQSSNFSRPFLRRFRGGNLDSVDLFFADTLVNFQLWALWEQKHTQTIWCATLSGDVFAVNAVSGDVRRIHYDQRRVRQPIFIYAFTEDEQQRVWMSASTGLYCFDAGGEFLGHYHDRAEGNFHLPATNVHHCHIDAEGVFWLATGDAGLLRWHPEGAVPTRTYTTRNGFPSMVLHAAYEDSLGYLWIPSENGIVQFHKDSEFAFHYGPDDGTVDAEFNRISHYRHPNGNLYFGGNTGITYFNPRHFHAKQQLAPGPDYLRLLDLLQRRSEDGAAFNRMADLIASGSITIYPADLGTRLTLVSPDLSPVPYLITSQVIGWQEHPIPVGSNGILLEGLPYQHYQLRIVAQDMAGRLLQEMTIPLRVIAPFYLRLWFILGILMAIIGIIYLVTSYQSARLRYLVAERTRQIEADKQIISQQAAELRRLDDLKSQFFANASHELRTPLTLLLDPLQQELEQATLPEPSQRRLQRAKEQAQQLLRLVNGILDLSKLDNEQMILESRPTAVRPLLQRIVEEFVSYAQQVGVSVADTYHFPEDLNLLTDASKLETIIRNLLANAVRFTPRGGRATLRAVYHDQHLRVVVTDTGRGIHPLDLPHVFERYYQARHAATSAEGGTGIGLAICKSFADLMGGTLIARSTLGQGSTFVLEIPAAVAERALPRGARPGERQSSATTTEGALPQVPGTVNNAVEVHPPSSPAGNGQRTILVVEDHPGLREHLVDILMSDFSVLTASNGREALERLNCPAASLPDLIITDLMMPEMDGMELLEQLKAHPTYASLPVIVLSARASTEDRLRALRIGVDDYILKPFNGKELRLRIANLLRNAAVRRKNLNSTPDPVEAPSFAISTDEATWLEEIKAIVQANLQDPDFGNEALAAAAFMSTRNLSRRIKAATGLSTNKFMLELRLLEARRLLEQRQPPTPPALAEAIGFQKTSYFATRFRDRFGVSPTEYLNALARESNAVEKN
ncbi:response regulator [Neolewinella lacunae]|uniref:histidine kinase n=1 Tax=Neolewinella lacunae TaxID=1517758 RepID=A0A923PK82_9BACT|nr:ATP-binding protein [Neolewinella lacunae]MBC6992733.1 response regulator [Neolewinella lacunae]MDN3635977.1 response regulator [Neolewinella lacunae]